MGAAAGFNAEDAVFGEGLVALQELGVFLGIDVVSDDGQVVAVPQRIAEGEGEGGFAGADGAADADS